jgi:16S rRNA (adenine1518-N6/adenine1519-N6)-dimethyltransferase
MKARKHFGQHFLVDGNVIRKIIGAIGPRPGEHFIEIGPGRGAITLPLLAAGVRLDAIEIDHDLARQLPGIIAAGRDENAATPGLTVHAADALRFEFRALAAPGERLRLAGNLPYNISTPLLFHLLDCDTLFSDLHVMLQKEVGDRMTAAHAVPWSGCSRSSPAVSGRHPRWIPSSCAWYPTARRWPTGRRWRLPTGWWRGHFRCAASA